MSNVQTIEQAIAKNTADYRAAVEALKNHPSQDRDWKTVEREKLKKAADDRDGELRQQRKEALQQERDRRYRAAFDHTGHVTTDKYRDLYARAAAAAEAGPKELERLRKQAANTNDRDLERALHHASYDNGYVTDDAPQRVQELIGFEYDNGLRKAVDSDARLHQLDQRLAREMRTPAPR